MVTIRNVLFNGQTLSWFNCKSWHSVLVSLFGGLGSDSFCLQYWLDRLTAYSCSGPKSDFGAKTVRDILLFVVIASKSLMQVK